MLNAVKSRFQSGKKLIYTLAFVLIVNCTLIIDNCTCQWVRCDEMNGLSVYSLTTLGNKIFAGTDSGIYTSTNSGSSWTHSTFLPLKVTSLAIGGNNIFAGIVFNTTPQYGGIYLSLDSGMSWTSISFLSPVYSLTTSVNNIFAGTESGVYISTNNGTNWNSSSLNFLGVYSLITFGNNIIAGARNIPLFSGGVYFSANNGVSWNYTDLSNLDVYCFVINGNNIYAGTSIDMYTQLGGLFRSTNNGSNWSRLPLTGCVSALAALGNNIFAGTIIVPNDSDGVYISTNNGSNWIKNNLGFGYSPWIRSLLIKNNYVFAGTTENSLWRRPLSDFIGINQISENVPSAYSLSQNYPNPFNPVTKIKFDIKKEFRNQESEVKLVIYDITGKEIQTLVNEKLIPGTYEVNWNASQYSSGVYFYKLQAEDFTDTKKLILLK